MTKYNIVLEYDTGLTENAVEHIMNDITGPDTEVVSIEEVDDDE